MRLTDKVDVLTSTDALVAAGVRAEVHYTTTAAIVSAGRTAIVEELRCVIEPIQFGNDYRIRWRGKVYSSDGAAMVRRRNGRDHHLTIPLRYVSG